MGFFTRRDRDRRDPSVLPQVRAPQVATSLEGPAAWNARPPRWNAEQAVNDGYLANVWVYRCARACAEAVAGYPLRAGAAVPQHEWETTPADYAEAAPLARLLGPPPGGPAPGLSARRLWAWAVVQYLVTGRCAMEVEWNAGQPVAL
jgi:hypothetical protein